ncbi:thioredoxin reductase (NADPH) [Ruminococcaceae bacterium YRB3002]|nr:thioredoxin reductase (NADPH) [Ruminococcaceae bacterium YRB3002]
MADIVIIGGGPAGLTAAVYARRAGMETVVFEGAMYGGQIVNTPEVENYPGIPKISGFDLAMSLYNQASDLGAEFVMEAVVAIERYGERDWLVRSEYSSVKAKAVIIATGANNRHLGLENEDLLLGRGISYCATCDGAFFKNKVVAVNGGGNTAVEDALYLAGIASKVYLIHRRTAFRAEQRLVERAISTENMEIVTPKTVTALHGEDRLTGITVRDAETGEESEISLDALFVAIGQVPAAAPFAGLTVQENGYIKAGEDCLTGTEGIFVAGDVRTKAVRQLTTAASDGAVAALAACEYVRLR